MSAEQIRCRSCGHVNDVTAFACDGCGASLVGRGAERWAAARERDLVIEQDVQRVQAVRSVAARAVMVVIVVLALTVVGWIGGSWLLANYYVVQAPEYDGHPPSYWADMMLTNEDRFMRRRAALAIDSICDRFNERTAREIVPSLAKALSDSDDVVRNRARSALDKIASSTGVTP